MSRIIPHKQIVFTMAAMQAAAENRPDGYLKECLRLGEMLEHGKIIRFSRAAFFDLRRRFPEKEPGRLWGNRLHKKLGPIGRKINWPCLSGDGTTDLKPGSPCNKARLALNTAGATVEKTIKKIFA